MDSKCEKGKICLQLQFEYAKDDGTTDGVKYVVFTSSEVLLKQIKQYEDKIPFLTVVVKQGNYYTFSQGPPQCPVPSWPCRQKVSGWPWIWRRLLLWLPDPQGDNKEPEQ